MFFLLYGNQKHIKKKEKNVFYVPKLLVKLDFDPYIFLNWMNLAFQLLKVCELSFFSRLNLTFSKVFLTKYKPFTKFDCQKVERWTKLRIFKSLWIKNQVWSEEFKD